MATGADDEQKLLPLTLIAQVGLSLVLALVLGILAGRTVGTSALLGGIAAFAPNAFLAARLMNADIESLMRAAWIGDGNNMAHSWVLAAQVFGFELALACPEGYRPDAALLESAIAAGARVSVGADPAAAAMGAHVVTTDVWASMGQEEEQAQRREAFGDYTVDAAVMAQADPGAVFLHCLPAHRGEEVSDGMLTHERSFVFDQAENRLHAFKALLAYFYDNPE